ncbi:MAG: DUF819 family protein [Bacteroidota bacterium]
MVKRDTFFYILLLVAVFLLSWAAQVIPEDGEALITNDATVLGLLIGILAFVFYTSSLDGNWKKFYTFVPSLLLCYFLPSMFNTLGVISGEKSQLYFVASRYLLPTSLVLLTLSIDLAGIKRLGPKAIIMFLAGTVGIVIGGPIAIMVMKMFNPEVVQGVGYDEATWRGLSTVAGSWIGGGANQTAMKEVFHAGDQIFSAMIAVDVIVANVWMGFLLYGAGITKRIDKWLQADSSSVEDVRKSIEDYQASVRRIPDLTSVMVLLAVGFGVTALSHAGADLIAPFVAENFPELAKFSLTSKFFWLIVLATTGGLILSFTKARQLEGVGASRFGSLFLYILVATIGMKMDITAIVETPLLFVVGLIWMLVHVTIQLGVGKLIKAPFFMIAVGSQANVGGAASAPIVASAFHPSLAPVGVLLAVLGYALGTYAAYICGLMMQSAAPYG